MRSATCLQEAHEMLSARHSNACSRSLSGLRFVGSESPGVDLMNDWGQDNSPRASSCKMQESQRLGTLKLLNEALYVFFICSLIAIKLWPCASPYLVPPRPSQKE